MTKSTVSEEERLLLQGVLDLAKTSEERNKLGQFATPGPLAREVVCELVGWLDPERLVEPLRVLDPALGTGAFWSAVQTAFPKLPVKGVGIEIDQAFADASRRLWTGTGLKVRCEDFTSCKAPSRDRDRFDLVICNPPYVRHHHIPTDRKPFLRTASAKAARIDLSGLAGLYCHFVAMAHPWMKRKGIAAWLIPSEFMDVNYGGPLKEYLLRDVTLLRVHQFDPEDVQFSDALVSSAVVIFRNDRPPEGHLAEFSRGSNLGDPVSKTRCAVEELLPSDRWTRLANGGERRRPSRTTAKSLNLNDLFSIRRGLVTGGNDFFVLSERQIDELQLPTEVLTPILPSPRSLTDLEVSARSDGSPELKDRKFLVNCDLPAEEIERRFPKLWSYLSTASQALRDRYICRNRSPWYRQEKRPAAPLLCTYLGRRTKSRRPFRFIFNHSNATAANVYHLLYPRPQLAAAMEADATVLRRIWTHLNTMDVDELLRESRVYGGGLHKLEPKELGQVSLEGLDANLRRLISDSAVPEFPSTELGATHQLLERVQLDT